MLEIVSWKFYTEVSAIGENSYMRELAKMALYSHGALTLEYLEKSSYSLILEVSSIMKDMNNG